MKELLLIMCLLIVGSVAGKVYIIENRPQNASGTNTTNNYYYNITNNITTYYNTTTYVNVTNNITSNDGTGGWVNFSNQTSTLFDVNITGRTNTSVPLSIYPLMNQDSMIKLYDSNKIERIMFGFNASRGPILNLNFSSIQPGINMAWAWDGVTAMLILNGGNGGQSKAQITVGQLGTGSNYGIFQHWGTNFVANGVQIADRTGLIGYDTQGFVLGTGTTSGTDRDLLFATLNTERMRIESAGFVGIGTDTTPDAQLAVDSQAAANIGLIVQGAASQSGDLTQWQNSGGTVLARVTAAGKIGLGTTTPTQMIDVFGTDPTIGFGSGGVLWRMGMESGKFKIVHTGVQEIVSISNDTLAYSSWGGAVGIETTEHWKPSATLTVNNTNATRQTSVFYAPQSAGRNITEWKNSSGATLAAIEADGTLVFSNTGTVFDDLVMPLLNARNPASDPADCDSTFTGGINACLFRTPGIDQMFATMQMSHAYKLRSPIDCHLHWAQSIDGTGTVNWTLEFTKSDINNIFPASTTFSCVQAANGTALAHQLCDFGTIGNFTSVSGLAHMRIARENTGGDTYAAGAFGLSLDCHYEIDTLGSRSAYVK